MKNKSSAHAVPSFAKFLIAAAALLTCSALHAQTNFYNDTTTFTGQGYSAQVAGAGGGGTITPLVADDLNLISSGAGATITAFQFTMFNFNTASASARPIVNFYASNGSGGGPGTLLASLTFNAITIAASSGSLLTAPTNSAGYFVVPANARIWAGVMFDNGGTSTATAAQVANFGQGLFNPPTVGSSTDTFFQSTANGPSGNNPAGGFFNFGGNPVANFGWRIAGTAPVAAPEGGSALMLMLVGVSGLLVARRRFARAAN